jgi:hypothetical protein
MVSVVRVSLTFISTLNLIYELSTGINILRRTVSCVNFMRLHIIKGIGLILVDQIGDWIEIFSRSRNVLILVLKMDEI